VRLGYEFINLIIILKDVGSFTKEFNNNLNLLCNKSIKANKRSDFIYL
jgi:hypothetical protein